MNGRVTLRLEARDGDLMFNGVNTGPCRSGAPVQFRSDHELIVDGEHRAIP